MAESKQIKLEVVTPDQVVVSEMVDAVVATGMEGEFGVLPGHIPFLASLAALWESWSRRFPKIRCIPP